MLEVAHDDRRQDFRRIDDILHGELDKLHRLSLEHTAHRAIAVIDELFTVLKREKPSYQRAEEARAAAGDFSEKL